ncbi:phosphohistidine phosphatase SixA [candidate division KSB1 bacterium]
MIVYLVQHGEALSEEEDRDRRLSGKGLADTRKTAAFLAQMKDATPEHLYHSGKTRAAQTAGIFGEHLKSEHVIEPVEGLKPMDSPGIWAERLNSMSESCMLIGHLPHLNLLASLLLCGNPDIPIIKFTNSGIVCLERSSENDWSLVWSVVPGILQ